MCDVGVGDPTTRADHRVDVHIDLEIYLHFRIYLKRRAA